MIKTRQVEKIVKGFSNHRRIEIMEFLERNPDAPLFEIADMLKINFKTASEHARRLALAHLVVKRARGSVIEHSLTPLGKKVLKFLRILE